MGWRENVLRCSALLRACFANIGSRSLLFDLYMLVVLGCENN
jgi:hypothetical protein